jgi:hypothetical protein
VRIKATHQAQLSTQEAWVSSPSWSTTQACPSSSPLFLRTLRLPAVVVAFVPGPIVSEMGQEYTHAAQEPEI